MSIARSFYGEIAEGVKVDVFTLTNSRGMTVKISNLGGIVLSIFVPDNKGEFKDVVLAYDKIEKYLVRGPYFGAIVGRVANRIAGGCFKLNGTLYKLTLNDGENHLHGGLKGFDKVVWEAATSSGENFDSLVLTYTSKDGEEGYPGNLEVKVTYILTEDNAVEIYYNAVSDMDTVINLTNHAYFNLSGHDAGDVLNHSVWINGDYFTPNNEASIPTGELRGVKGTPMDFTKLTRLREVIDTEDEQIKFGKGFDHNWVLKVSGELPEKAAEVYDDKSGRLLTVYTTKPGIQLYTSNYLDGTDIGKDNVPYEKRSGLCLETQFFPNSINQENFPSPILRAKEEYKHITIYKFATLPTKNL